MNERKTKERKTKKRESTKSKVTNGEENSFVLKREATHDVLDY